MTCTVCDKEQNAIEYYYKSNSYLFQYTQRMSACKVCVLALYQVMLDKYIDMHTAAYHTCRILDVYWSADVFSIAFDQSQSQKSNPMQIYFQKVNSLPQYGALTFGDTVDAERIGGTRPAMIHVAKKIKGVDGEPDFTLDDDKNRRDVLRVLNYDPFQSENDLDKRHLYNILVDFLDESTLEDSFKLAAVIEIVKSFGQIDKLNRAIANVTQDPNNLANQVSALKSLIDAKEKLTKAVLGFAKDNGISVNHNNTKSKGAGTLSGIIKQLQERGFTEGEVNLFNVETAQGLMQVAELSNQAIRLQLNFDENDYTEMINQQRELVIEQGNRISSLEEELRKAKLSLLQGTKQIGEDDG